MKRHSATVEVLAGTFNSQLLVFAHLHDHCIAHGISLDTDHVQVITKVDPTPRLQYVFPQVVVDQVVDNMGLDTTLVLMLPGAVQRPFGSSAKLRGLGQWQGSLVVP